MDNFKLCEKGSSTIEAALISGFTMIFIYIMSYFMIANIYSDGVESYSNMKDNSSLYESYSSVKGIYIKADKNAVKSEEDEKTLNQIHKTLGTPIENKFIHWKQGPNLLKNQMIRDMINVAKER